MTTPTTPEQARKIAEHAPYPATQNALRSLADQVEALTAERDGWKDHIEAVVDIYFDGTENPEEHRAYVDGAFPAIMNDLRAAIAKVTA